MRRFHVAAEGGGSSQPPDKTGKEGLLDEQELRDILRESDEKAKQLFERREPGRCDSPENSLKRIASRKRGDTY
jgi:hypothetical protein